MQKLRSAAFVIGLLLLTSPVLARATTELAYRYDQVWNAAIRLVRVDYGFELKDQDEQNGYLLFDYRDGNRTYPGSIELVRVPGQGREVVRVHVGVPAMPSYLERAMVQKLEKKLRDDFGEPLPPPPRRAPREDSGSGEDGGRGKGGSGPKPEPTAPSER